MSSHRPVLAPGRTAVITGAAKGIGEGTARKLADLGMNLCLFDRDHHALQVLCGELQTRTRVVPISGDVTCESDLTHLRDIAFESFGEVALLMNNAGIIDAAGPWSDLATWRRQIEVNLLSMVTAQSLFVPRMLAQGGPGCIVNLGSKEGITTPPGNAAYSVAKAGEGADRTTCARPSRGTWQPTFRAPSRTRLHLDADEPGQEARGS